MRGSKSKNSGFPFDSTAERMLQRRPRFEKDYQKDLTFYLAKACEYLPWRFYVEFELNYQGRQGFVDLVLRTKQSQDMLLELKKGPVTEKIVEEVFARDYVEGYRRRTKNSKYPFLYLIGDDFSSEAQCYSEELTKQLRLEAKRCKYKPKVLVRTYWQLMQFLDRELAQTQIGQFELQRLQRDVPLLYGSGAR